LSADGAGTNAIMRKTGKAKTCVWRWQERFMQAGANRDGVVAAPTPTASLYTRSLFSRRPSGAERAPPVRVVVRPFHFGHHFRGAG
jgi:hypothetical protein